MLFSLDSIKLVAAQSLAPGALFRIADHRRALGPLCMRAKFDDAEAYVLLDGDNYFRVQETHAHTLAIPVVTHALHVQPDATQPDRMDEWAPGSLVVTEAGVSVTVEWQRMGGSSNTYRLDLLTGVLDESDTRRYACAANWRLVDRDEHGVETVLCTTGDMN